MKKLLFICLIGILMFGVVSASDWDNKLTYSNKDLKVTFDNTFLGVKTTEIGTAELKSHNSVNYVKKVGLGEQVVMYYDFNFKENYKNGLGDVTFTNMIDSKKVKRDYDYVYWGNVSYNVSTYSTSYSSNGTEIYTKNGTQTKVKQDWIDYDSKDITKGKIRIGIRTNVEADDYIDGVWTIAGKEVKKHAAWTVSLNVDLISYYKLDEETGNAIDSLGSYDATKVGTPTSTTGKINYGYEYDISTTDGFYSAINLSTTDTTPFSINMWVYLNGYNGVNRNLLTYNSDYGQVQIDTKSDNKIEFRVGGCTSSYNSATIGSWYMLTISYDGTTKKDYINGTSIGNHTCSLNANANKDGTFWIGNAQASAGGSYSPNATIDEVGFWSRGITYPEVTQLYNGGTGIGYLQGNMTINLLSPTNNEYLNDSSVSFSSNITSNDNTLGIVNATINVTFFNGTQVYTNTNSSTYSGIYNWTKTLNDGSYNYSVRVYGNDSVIYNSSNYHFYVDTTAPTINITSPLSNYNVLTNGQSIDLNFSASDTNLDTCWYNYNGTNITQSCSANTTFTYEINNNNLTFYVNDSAGNNNSEFVSWTSKIILNNSITYNSSSYETSYESYKLNVTANTSLTAVNLIYNGTSYPMIKSGTIWSYARDLPSTVIGNNSLNFSFTYAGNTYYATSLYYQNVLPIQFGLCNATITNDFLNISFKDESTLSFMNGSIPLSTWSYYLGTGTQTKSYTYSTTTNASTFRFCATPTARTFKVTPYVQYKLGTSYPQRIWQDAVQYYTSALTNKTLYLLGSTVGIYTTIQVINAADQVISGVQIDVTREISGSDVNIGTGTTGDDGSVTFWVNPDYVHTFALSKDGYTDYTTSFAPTQTSYTITLGGSTTNTSNYFQGIVYSILPRNTFLINDTSYAFKFNLTSSYWDVSDYGFSIRLSNGTLIDGGSTGVEGTELTKNYDVNNQTVIYFDYYWLINGTYINASRYWIVQNTQHTGWSINTFFTDLTTYIDSGIFGLDSFGLNIIIFLLIFIPLGIMSYKYSMTSPLSITFFLFGIIFFLDIVIGIIPNIRGIEHLLTYISGLILVISAFMEVQSR